MTIDRRDFLKGGIGTAAAAVLPVPLAHAVAPVGPTLITGRMSALLARTQATRVVVCGGGWGGLTAAKYLKQEDPTLDVVLLERNPIFFS